MIIALSIVTYFIVAVLVSRAVWIHTLRLVRSKPKLYYDSWGDRRGQRSVWNYYGSPTVVLVSMISLFWPFVGLALGVKWLAYNGWSQVRPAVRAFYSDPKNKEIHGQKSW